MYVSSEGQVGGELKKKETGNANIRFEKYGWEWGERGGGGGAD